MVVKALAHPLRVEILRILDEGRSSPIELSRRLDAPLGVVSYHVRVLSDLGLIRLVKRTARRGAIEHHYAAAPGLGLSVLTPSLDEDGRGALAEAIHAFRERVARIEGEAAQRNGEEAAPTATVVLMSFTTAAAH
jgi:DNA-binding transcriptional ArsR family regulator